MQQWSFDPVFGSYLTVLTTVLLLLCTFFFVRPWTGIARHRRWWLFIIRCFVVLVLAVAMLRPGTTISETRTKKALILFLVDETESMNQPSVEPQITRWEHQMATWQSVQSVIEKRADEVSVRLYSYTDAISENRLTPETPSFPETPAGEQTDIGTSLFQAVTSEPGRQIHAVVLLGDGTQTSYRPKVDLREAMDQLRNHGIPLITVPFGRVGDTFEARDIAIEQLPQQYRVFSGNIISLDCLARLRGVQNRPLKVQLWLTTEQGTPQVLDTVEVVADRAEAVVPVNFQWTAAEPGNYQFSVQAETVEGELLVENNTQTAFLTVLEGGLRVLYFYGNRIGEQLELRRSLAASPDIELTEHYIRHNQNPSWPDPRTQIVGDDEYDVLIIEDVHAQAFGNDHLTAIASAVEQGKGLMMVGGYYSFGPGGYLTTPVDPVLPIKMEVFEKQEIGVENPVRTLFHLDRELTLKPVGDHPVTSILVAPSNWNDLPPLLGANRFQGLKPSAKVILESGQQDPLLVTNQYGLGRVLAFAGDSTWRWARMGHATSLRRFWRQSILWLARREDLQQQDVWLRMDQRRFTPNMEIPFELGMDSLGTQTIPASSVSWEVSLIQGEQPPKPLTIHRQDEQWAGLLASLADPGNYEIHATAKVEQEILGQARVPFQVIDVQPEKSNPLADIPQLKRLANMTDEHGGQMVLPEKIAQHLNQVIDQTKQLEVQVEVTWQFGRAAGSAWLILTIISSLLALDWFLRKKWGLV